eukprot:7186835-Alexandrium_andersonii.AAC.1
MGKQQRVCPSLQVICGCSWHARNGQGDLPGQRQVREHRGFAPSFHPVLQQGVVGGSHIVEPPFDPPVSRGGL